MGLKERIAIRLKDTYREYADIEENYSDVIKIYKNTWGYTEIDVEVEGDFFYGCEPKIRGDQFNGNTVEYTYFINASRLHGGSNHGKIKFRTPNETLVYDIIVVNEAIKDDAYINAKKSAISFVKNYLAFRTGQISGDEWKKKMVQTAEDRLDWDKDDFMGLAATAQVAILDNDKSKQGTVLDGYPIISPNDIAKYSFDALVVLSFYIKEMKSQLLELGVSEDKIYHFYDLRALFEKEQTEAYGVAIASKSILLLSHDLSLGGPALALFHAAETLKKSGYDVAFASMLDGDLRNRIEDAFIPVIIDHRLQISTMNELTWTQKYDLIICNTINFNVFLSERDNRIPVIWWLHDSSFFYEGIKSERLTNMDMTNMKVLSVGPVPQGAMMTYRDDVSIEDLIYGVSSAV